MSVPAKPKKAKNKKARSTDASVANVLRNLQESTKQNIFVLKTHDPQIENILYSCTHVTVYKLLGNSDEPQWEKAGIEGPLFICQRRDKPYCLFILNRMSLENLCTPVDPSVLLETDSSYVFYQCGKDVFGLWFHAPEEMKSFLANMEKLLAELREEEKTKRQDGSKKPAPLTPMDAKAASASLMEMLKRKPSSSALERVPSRNGGNVLTVAELEQKIKQQGAKPDQKALLATATQLPEHTRQASMPIFSTPPAAGTAPLITPHALLQPSLSSSSLASTTSSTSSPFLSPAAFQSTKAQNVLSPLSLSSASLSTSTSVSRPLPSAVMRISAPTSADLTSTTVSSSSSSSSSSTSTTSQAPASSPAVSQPVPLTTTRALSFSSGGAGVDLSAVFKQLTATGVSLPPPPTPSTTATSSNGGASGTGTPLIVPATTSPSNTSGTSATISPSAASASSPALSTGQPAPAPAGKAKMDKAQFRAHLMQLVQDPKRCDAVYASYEQGLLDALVQ